MRILPFARLDTSFSYACYCQHRRVASTTTTPATHLNDIVHAKLGVDGRLFDPSLLHLCGDLLGKDARRREAEQVKSPGHAAQQDRPELVPNIWDDALGHAADDADEAAMEREVVWRAGVELPVADAVDDQV